MSAVSPFVAMYFPLIKSIRAFPVISAKSLFNEVISFALEGDRDAGFTYEGTHMQEVTDNKIREVCNGLILLGSPLYTIKSGESETIENMTFVTEIAAE